LFLEYGRVALGFFVCFVTCILGLHLAESIRFFHFASSSLQFGAGKIERGNDTMGNAGRAARFHV